MDDQETPAPEPTTILERFYQAGLLAADNIDYINEMVRNDPTSHKNAPADAPANAPADTGGDAAVALAAELWPDEILQQRLWPQKNIQPPFNYMAMQSPSGNAATQENNDPAPPGVYPPIFAPNPQQPGESQPILAPQPEHLIPLLQDFGGSQGPQYIDPALLEPPPNPGIPNPEAVYVPPTGPGYGSPGGNYFRPEGEPVDGNPAFDPTLNQQGGTPAPGDVFNMDDFEHLFRGLEIPMPDGNPGDVGGQLPDLGGGMPGNIFENLDQYGNPLPGGNMGDIGEQNLDQYGNPLPGGNMCDIGGYPAPDPGQVNLDSLFDFPTDDGGPSGAGPEVEAPSTSTRGRGRRGRRGRAGRERQTGGCVTKPPQNPPAGHPPLPPGYQIPPSYRRPQNPRQPPEKNPMQNLPVPENPELRSSGTGQGIEYLSARIAEYNLRVMRLREKLPVGAADTDAILVLLGTVQGMRTAIDSMITAQQEQGGNQNQGPNPAQPQQGHNPFVNPAPPAPPAAPAALAPPANAPIADQQWAKAQRQPAPPGADPDVWDTPIPPAWGTPRGELRTHPIAKSLWWPIVRRPLLFAPGMRFANQWYYGWLINRPDVHNKHEGDARHWVCYFCGKSIPYRQIYHAYAHLKNQHKLKKDEL